MNQQAQNALLKTIEEPPAYAVIMLLTTNADSFLQTIRSRCITLNMKSVKDEVIKAYLMNEKHIPDYQADISAAFAQGIVGKAVKLDVNGLIFKDEVYDIKKQAAKHSYQGIEAILEALEKAKIRINANVNFDLVIELLLMTIKEN